MGNYAPQIRRLELRCTRSPSIPLTSRLDNESLLTSHSTVYAPNNTGVGVFASCVREGIMLNL
eukprot:5190516-Prorocentrum_lima.AAC.1